MSYSNKYHERTWQLLLLCLVTVNLIPTLSFSRWEAMQRDGRIYEAFLRVGLLPAVWTIHPALWRTICVVGLCSPPTYRDALLPGTLDLICMGAFSRAEPERVRILKAAYCLATSGLLSAAWCSSLRKNDSSGFGSIGAYPSQPISAPLKVNWHRK